jgi:vancomycin resistance protein YoaR
LRADASSYPAPARPAHARRSRVAWRWFAALGALAAAVVVAALLLWLAFAGSPARLAEGTRVAGVEVGGLTTAEARALLERRAAELAHTPGVFVSGSQRFALTPARLGIEVDWAAAVDAARREGEGFGPVRGLRRLQTRVFGVDVAPPARVYTAALAYELGRIQARVDRRPREAAVVRRGLRIAVVPERTGQALDRRAAEALVVRSLAGFSRAPVALPVQVTEPRTTAAELARPAAQARTALSGPVRLQLAGTRWRLPRWRIAELLLLPANGSATLAIGGPGADRYFDRLERVVGRPPADAAFVPLADRTVTIAPARPGVALDRPATERALLAAAVSPTRRLARVSVFTARPKLSTRAAAGLGVTHVLSSYWTAYAGTADRVRNLQLAVSLLDGARVAPGATFSFNGRVGPRTEARGFRPAPVIVDGEYEEGIGGGVSQVATTVFNAAWEAGVKIAARAPHSLYISRYPTGRDATVNYPDLDLRFVNDTDRWIVLRAFSGDSGITISLLGAPTGRRVVSEAGELRVTGPAPVERVEDPTLFVGESAVVEEGEPPRKVAVRRTVFEADGDVLYAETWTTSYRGEMGLVRVGSKPRPKPPPPEAKTTTTAPTTTAPTTTAEEEEEPPPPPPPPG